MRKLLALAAGSTLLLAACLDIDYGLAINRDLSGTAALDVEIDLERMAYVSAKMQRMFGGQEGEPTPEELAVARQELASQMEEDELDEAELRQEIEEDLPAGVRLLGAEHARDGLKRRISLKLAFDHIERLNAVHMGPDEAQMGEESGSRPFGDLEVVDEGSTLLITNAPINPVRGSEESVGAMPGMGELLATAFEGLRVSFSLQSPFQVVEHNASRADSNTLVWEFGPDDLSSEGETPGTIRVRYRK